MRLQLIRNATLRITYGSHCFLMDPYFADKLSRPSYSGKSKNPLVALPFHFDEILHGIKMVLVSHMHSDHFDEIAQNTIPKKIPILCQTEDEMAINQLGFEHVYPIKESIDWDGIKITRILGEHGTGDVLKEMGITSGFFFEMKGEPSIYWTGDTILSHQVRKVIKEKQPKIIITHSCGAEWGDRVKIVMDHIQTIDVCKMSPNSIIIATHMDSVDHATVSRNSLRKYARMNSITDEQLLIPSDGEIVDFTANNVS